MGEDDYLEQEQSKEYSQQTPARRGKMSQIMVLVNGLVLTLTAFITFYIFLDQIKETRTKTLQTSIVNKLEKEFSDMGQDLFVAGSLLNGGVSKRFHAIAKFEKREGQKWKVSKISGYAPVDDASMLFSTVLDELKHKNFAFFIKKDPFWDEVPKPSETENKIYVAQRIGGGTIVVGEWRPEYLARSFAYSEHYGSLKRLKMFEEMNGGKLFDFRRSDYSNEDIKGYEIEQYIETLSFKDNKLSFAIDIAQDPHFLFVSKLPYLVFLFGVTLTLIGTLYIRNNQKQSLQLEKMNNALEEKNVALQKNIKESRDLYKEMSRKEKEYETVLNVLEGVLFEIDLTGHIHFMNAAWKNLTQTDVDDVLSRDLFKFILPSDEDNLRLAFSRFIEDQKPVQLKTKIYQKSGYYRSVEVSFSVVHKNQYGQRRVIGTMTDIENQRRAEKALDEAEKKYRTIVENAAGGIYQITIDGHVMSANPALANILGYNDVDDILRDDFNMTDVFVSAEASRVYNHAMNTDGFIRNHEIQIRRRNGDIIWVNENARAVKGVDNKIEYYEGSLEDITQRKQAEIDLKEAKLNSDLASRAKSEFLANMSHELRTPLNSIIGFSEIIKSEALGEIQQKPYVDYAKDIYTSGSRLLTVINEILGISKIEAGERQLNESVVNLGNVTQVCVDLLASKIEASGVEITNMLPDLDLPNVVAEEMAFKQMIMNLLSNAIKFTPQGGKITISSEYKEGGDMRFSITDTGVGIAESDIPKVLSPFGQLDNALSRSNSGTGLGLTLVDSLIRLHGGRLEMISQKGIGTTVTLVVPEKRVAVKRHERVDENHDDNVTSLSDYKKH